MILVRVSDCPMKSDCMMDQPEAVPFFYITTASVRDSQAIKEMPVNKDLSIVGAVPTTFSRSTSGLIMPGLSLS